MTIWAFSTPSEKSPLTFDEIPQEIKDAVDFVFNADAIKEISGEEFQKDGVPLTDKVTKFYEDKYNGKAYNPELGEVKLDKEGVKAGYTTYNRSAKWHLAFRKKLNKLIMQSK